MANVERGGGFTGKGSSPPPLIGFPPFLSLHFKQKVITVLVSPLNKHNSQYMPSKQFLSATSWTKKDTTSSVVHGTAFLSGHIDPTFLYKIHFAGFLHQKDPPVVNL